jgi:hypothetical protein
VHLTDGSKPRNATCSPPIVRTMTDVVIGEGLQTLTLARTGDWSTTDRETLSVTLSGIGLRAELDISAGYTSFAGLGGFFSKLADDWQGWDGERTYETLEHDLVLRATHRGHVRIDVSLNETKVDGWSASASILIEAGEELSQICFDVATLVGRE